MQALMYQPNGATVLEPMAEPRDELMSGVQACSRPAAVDQAARHAKDEEEGPVPMVLLDPGKEPLSTRIRRLLTLMSREFRDHCCYCFCCGLTH